MLNNIFYGYFTITLVVFGIWFSLFLLDKTTPKDHFVSWVILLVAPWFWPIVLPVSIRELFVKARIRRGRKDQIQLEKPLKSLQTNELNTNW